MKKYIVLAVCLGMLLVSSMAMATDYSIKVKPGNGIKGTAHDLSQTGATASGRTDLYGSADINNKYLPGGNLDRICVWCHTPHFSMKPGDIPTGTSYNYLPLWNHDLTAATYTTYSNGTFEPGDTNHKSEAEALKKQPGSMSKLCLSCHDGSIAVNAYGRVPTGTGKGDDRSTGARNEFMKVDGDYIIGQDNDLSNHHPVGFVYDDVETTDDEIQKSTEKLGLVYTIADLLVTGQMECTTCHDVHNTKNTGEKFLWISDEQSALCLSCHLKGSTKKAAAPAPAP